MAPSDTAPTVLVPKREVVAVEHPMIIKDVDKGLQTLGLPYDQLVYPDSYDESLPVYLRPGDPSCAPILSHNLASSNVVFSITVPKRTGRKRPRGSQEPFKSYEEHGHAQDSQKASKHPALTISSQSRDDLPSKIRRTLQDNVGRYDVKAIGIVSQTHRFRGLADYHYSTAHGPFMTKFRDTIMTGELDKLKQFRIDPSRGPKPDDEIVPPPSFTDHPIPFNWGYKQNAQITVDVDITTGKRTLKNSSIPKKIYTYYISSSSAVVPSGPQKPPPDDETHTHSMLATLREAFEERPMWTRRALSNRLGNVEGQYLFKECLQYVCYQFRGGPWRDSVIKFGVDPRSDPKYRIYQTLFFKIYNEDERKPGAPWHDVRSEYTRRAVMKGEDIDTHLFDGTTVHLDGKLWQICDITDPVCLRIINTDNLRDSVELDSDGWYQNGTMAKLKAVMRCKISAIQYGRIVPDEDFEEALSYPDIVTDRRYINIPVPDFRGSAEDRELWKKRNPGKDLPKLGSVGVSSRISHAFRRHRQKVEHDESVLSSSRRSMSLESSPQVDIHGGAADLDPRVQVAMEVLRERNGMDSPVRHELLGPEADGLVEEYVEDEEYVEGDIEDRSDVEDNSE